MLRIIIGLIFSFSAALAPASDFVDALVLDSPVVDQANLFSSSEKTRLETYIRNIKQKQGTQIGVLTLNSLNGQTIEQVSIEIADKWQLGDKKLDDGLLILISKEDRSLRIEVGQGLEGALPDAYASQIIDQIIKPAFQNGQFAVGVFAGIQAAMSKIAPETSFAAENDSQVSSPAFTSPKISLFKKILGLIFILFLILTPWGRAFLLAMLLSGRGGGGYGRRGGGGFGGYSGGGGGFSGGGASGRW